jgi:hypothetical protein
MRGHTAFTKNRLALCLALALTPLSALAFDSGSTGALGAFSPTTNTVVQLPPDGTLNYTTVNIPTGVTVTFAKNQTNTPVVMLASGGVTIAGTIDISGTHAAHAGPTGDGVLADDGNPGLGGPGGYDGGRGGVPGSSPSYVGGAGRGPGGGLPGQHVSGVAYTGGGGGGYRDAGASGIYSPGAIGDGGSAYGSPLLLPLLGGSGGGGGAGGGVYHGTGGGGGGGAILIASSGTVTVTGTIKAKGGNGGDNDAASGYGGGGGGGSGGAIRIVATTIAGNGSILAQVGGAYDMDYYHRGGNGALGRIRLEAEISQRTAATDPAYTLGKPGSIFLPGLPSLRITSVADVAAPAEPSGSADITFPADLTNPVTVQFAATGVPPGSAVTLTVTPAIGVPVLATSAGLAGTTDSSTASVSVSLPKGPSVLLATTSYTLTLAQGEALSMCAQGERVERVELAASSGGTSMVTLVTVSGKKHTLPSSMRRIIGG